MYPFRRSMTLLICCIKEWLCRCSRGDVKELFIKYDIWYNICFLHIAATWIILFLKEMLHEMGSIHISILLNIDCHISSIHTYSQIFRVEYSWNMGIFWPWIRRNRTHLIFWVGNISDFYKNIVGKKSCNIRDYCPTIRKFAYFPDMDIKTSDLLLLNRSQSFIFPIIIYYCSFITAFKFPLNVKQKSASYFLVVWDIINFQNKTSYIINV